MESHIGVDLHLRTATICHRKEDSEHNLRTLELHSLEWQQFWDSVPPGSDVFVEMSRTTLVVCPVGARTGPSGSCRRSGSLPCDGYRTAEDGPE